MSRYLINGSRNGIPKNRNGRQEGQSLPTHSGLGLLERKSHTRSATFHLTKGIARELLGKAAYTRARGLNPIRYAEMVREYLHDHPSITNRDVRELLGLGESATAQVEASRYLKRWSDPAGFLSAEGSGPKRCYRLRNAS